MMQFATLLGISWYKYRYDKAKASLRSHQHEDQDGSRHAVPHLISLGESDHPHYPFPQWVGVACAPDKG